jgi:hypothetical protein
VVNRLLNPRAHITDSPAPLLPRHLLIRGGPLRRLRKPSPVRSAAQTPLYTIAPAAMVVRNLPQFRLFPPVSGVSFAKCLRIRPTSVVNQTYTARKSERPQDVSAKTSAGCTKSGNEVKIVSWPYEFSKNKWISLPCRSNEWTAIQTEFKCLSLLGIL